MKISPLFSKAILALALFSSPLFALTGGPAMPEYRDFESVEQTDLVNMATGDFTYSIPAVVVPGPGISYPLNLSYHAGIRVEQEASWVGLGWSLNAGAVNRDVNKIPDDFDGEMIREYIKSQHVYGWMTSVAWNGYTVGLTYNNQNGYGGIVGYSWGSIGGTVGFDKNGLNSVDVSAKIGLGDSPASLNIGVGWDRNGNFGPSVGLGVDEQLSKNGIIGSVSLGYDSRTGGASASIGLSQAVKSGDRNTSMGLVSLGVSLGSSGLSRSVRTAISVENHATVTASTFSRSGGGFIPFWSPWTGYIQQNWGYYEYFAQAIQEDLHYGFLNTYLISHSKGSNNHNTGIQVSEEKPDLVKPTFVRRKMELNIASNDISSINGSRIATTTEDLYSVNGQGMSGSFSPQQLEDFDYYSFRSPSHKQTTEFWCFYDCTSDQVTDYMEDMETNRNYLLNNSIEWKMKGEIGGGIDMNPNTRSAKQNASVSNKIIPITSGRRIKAWVLVKPDGNTYVYAQPLASLGTTIYSKAAPYYSDDAGKTEQTTPDYNSQWLLTSILAPDFERYSSSLNSCKTGNYDDCKNLLEYYTRSAEGGWVKFNYSSPQIQYWSMPMSDSRAQYGHSEVITTSRMGAPYVFKREGVSTGVEMSCSILYGCVALPVSTKYYVYEYIDNTRSGDKWDCSISPDVCIHSHGAREVRYLESIETSTHIAKFFKSSRKDMKSFGGDLLTYNASESNQNAALSGLNQSEYEQILGTGSTHFATNPLRVHNPSSNYGYSFAKIYNNIEFTENQHWVRFTKPEETDEAIGTINYPVNSYNPWGGVYMGYRRYAIPASSAQKLDSIKLYRKLSNNDLEPIQGMKFKYDYTLSPKTPNSAATSDLSREGKAQGKLTLRSITVSNDGDHFENAFSFDYGFNPEYPSNTDMKDGWGFYKSGPHGAGADAWSLKKIYSGGGGVIDVDYSPKMYKVHDRDLALFTHSYNLPSEVIGYYKNRIKDNELIVSGTVTHKKYGMSNCNEINDGSSEVNNENIFNFNENTETSCNKIGPMGPYNPNTSGSVSMKTQEFSIKIDPSNNGYLYGGGLSTTKVTYSDVASGTGNQLNYSYFDGVAPMLNLPAKFSKIELLAHYINPQFSSKTGLDWLGGNHSVFYKKVAVNTKNIKNNTVAQNHGQVEYEFITPEDLPVTLTEGSFVENAVKINRLKLIDPSGFWGSEITKKELNPAGEVIRSENRNYYFQSSEYGTSFTGLADPVKSHLVMVDEIPNLDGIAKGITPIAKTTNVYSYKYFERETPGSGLTNYNTQMIREELVPVSHSIIMKMDGVTSSETSDLFDYKSGQVLISHEENSLGEKLVHTKVLAHQTILGFAKKNMLEQTLASFSFRPNSSVAINHEELIKLNPLAVGSFLSFMKLAAATYTLWRPIDEFGNTVLTAYTGNGSETMRIAGEYKWNDKLQTGQSVNSFRLLDLSGNGVNGLNFTMGSGSFNAVPMTPKTNGWHIGGVNEYFSPYGQVLQFRAFNVGNGSGVLTSQHMDERYGVIQSSAVGANYDGFMATSFELEEENSNKNSKDGIVNLGIFDEDILLRNKHLSPIHRAGRNSLYFDTRKDNGVQRTSNQVCFKAKVNADTWYDFSVWYHHDGDPESFGPIVALKDGGNSIYGTWQNINEILASVTGRNDNHGWQEFKVRYKTISKNDLSIVSANRTEICLGIPDNTVGSFDDLRLAPVGAQVTTYQYDRKGRMISSESPSGQVVFYTYDKSNKLMAIKDAQGRVLSERGTVKDNER